MNVNAALSTFAQGGSLLPVAASLFGGSDSGPPGGDFKAMKSANMAAIAGKMEAAEKYGISKLYALGAPTVSPAVSVGGESSSGLGEALANMGQDISRSVAAGQSDMERTIQKLTLEKAGLENEYLRAQINSVNSRTTRESGPPMPVPGALNPETLKQPSRTTGINLGVGYQTNPYVSDAQTLTDRYGEGWLEWLLPFVIGGADAYHNMPSRPRSVGNQYLQGRTR